MKINYDPWDESHAPKSFERYDKTGRWSPIHDEPEPAWVQWVGGVAAGVVLAVMLFLMV